MKNKRSKRKGSKKAAQAKPTVIVSEPPLEHGLEDAGNGERFVEQHGVNLRYVRLWKRWLVWNGSVWSEEDDGILQQLAKLTARSIYREADRRPSSNKAIYAHARRTLSVTGRARMLESAGSEPTVIARPGDFNADPMLFNVLNGTINLETGELRPHQQTDLITKIAPVEYHPGAKHALWDTFLSQMVPDDTIREYLQRACFYTLMGSVGEHVFFFLVGRPGSGKGSFLDAISGVMGPMYATNASFNILLDGKGNRFALARHEGSRMVVAQEVNRGDRFNTALVKALTGDDAITVERKFQNDYEIKPSWTWWLASNFRPHVDHDDGGMFRRLREVPFLNELAEDRRNPDLRRALRTKPEVQQAILAWIIGGRESYWANRLAAPPAIKLACAEYRDKDDTFLKFFQSTYATDPAGRVKTADVTAAYIAWCEENGVAPIERLDIPGRLKEDYGFTRTLIGSKRLAAWRGFRPREDEEDEMDALWRESQERDEQEDVEAYAEMCRLIEASA